MMVQVTKILIIYLMADVPPNQNEKWFDIGFSILEQLESTLFQQFTCSHTLETNLQPTLQQWQNDNYFK